jgi:uncharacterized membrane protein
MEVIISLVLGFLCLATIALPWIHRTKIIQLRYEIHTLKGQLNAVKTQLRLFERLLEKQGISVHGEEMVSKEVTSTVPSTHSPEPPVVAAIPPAPDIAEKREVTDTAMLPPTSLRTPPKERISFEQQFGARLPVWIGGVALALAGFYMVKYSIETGLLSPEVRVILGILFGVGMLYAANWVRTKPDFSNGTRIAQALSGAAIADLYVCMFAATTLYELIPPFVGFVSLTSVTILAVISSLRHGMPIALLGLIGGFLTPAMVSSNNPNAPLLFFYLYFVLTGFMVVIRKQCWWGFSIPTVIAAFLWVCLWLLSGNFVAGDALYLGLFLLAVSATVVTTSKERYLEETNNIAHLTNPASLLNYITLGGALLLLGTVTAQAGFGAMEWVLFALLSLGGIALAYFHQSLYGLVPWMAMAVNLVMLVSWDTADTDIFALTLALFAAIYSISGYVLQSRSERPLLWAGLISATFISYYLLGYAALIHTEFTANIPRFWGIVALCLAGITTYILQQIMRDVPSDHPQKQHLLGIYAATSTAFISLALTIELPREFLSVAFALQIVAMAWIYTRIDLPALRALIKILAIIFGFLLIPQLLLLLQLTVYSLTEQSFYPQHDIPIVQWPLFQLGVPALCFASASYLLRKQADDKLVYLMEIATLALLGVMGYYLTRQLFHPDQSVLFTTPNFIERGVITNVLFIYGLGCVWGGRTYVRKALTRSGCVLCAVALFRIGYFDLLLHNPLWSPQKVGAWFLINGLLLPYALPLLWLRQGIAALPDIGKPHWIRYGYAAMLLLAFTFLSLTVRQLYHGEYLNASTTSNAEIYSYSVLWLLFGLGLLFFGTVRRDKLIRTASLLVMLLTVGKVFLYDASELQGLLRVFSFFGLGISLLALSWFYTRFVFTGQEKENGN